LDVWTFKQRVCHRDWDENGETFVFQTNHIFIDWKIRPGTGINSNLGKNWLIWKTKVSPFIVHSFIDPSLKCSKIQNCDKKQVMFNFEYLKLFGKILFLEIFKITIEF
jgi:hypothetical protein